MVVTCHKFRKADLQSKDGPRSLPLYWDPARSKWSSNPCTRRLQAQKNCIPSTKSTPSVPARIRRSISLRRRDASAPSGRQDRTPRLRPNLSWTIIRLIRIPQMPCVRFQPNVTTSRAGRRRPVQGKSDSIKPDQTQSDQKISSRRPPVRRSVHPTPCTPPAYPRSPRGTQSPPASPPPATRGGRAWCGSTWEGRGFV